ncbi:EamA family transporter [Ostreiculturibacter nitratireducens]|uniref:EamA family transporter n=1 Tax=Ostreiculturibacter nitratireducens TaxID=3075226 RepID=UPI0031B619BD
MAAALHAGWNAIVKGSRDKLVSALAICIAAAGIAAVALPFVEQPARESWGHIGLSVTLQTIYYALVAAAYGRADMSVAYPVMRGGAPLIVAAAMAAVFAETLSPGGWAGVALISAGILSMALLGRGGAEGIGFAVANAAVIAGYTINDGIGVRASGAAVGYTLWIFLLTAPPFIALAVALRGGGIIPLAVRRWRDGIIGGLGTMLAYGVALWAMVLAPVAMVAALRETSILFATIISAVILRESIGRERIAAVGLIALGAGALRLG